MFRKLPKNLAPQFIPMSRTPNRVLEIEDTLESPQNPKLPPEIHHLMIIISKQHLTTLRSL